MGSIRVDYANARAQAKKLQAVASDCDDVVRQLNNAINSVPNCWDGESADAFVLSVQARIKEVRKIGSNAASVAAQIRRVADELEEAERRVQAEIAAQKGGLTVHEDTIILSSSDGPSGGGSGGGGFR